MIDGVTNSGAIPVLERLMQFTEQRHRLITNNIANFSTPGFRPADVSVATFQKQLGEAVELRRNQNGPSGDLHVQDTAEVEIEPDRLTLHPQATGENILFHDGNDRDVERTMQAMVENLMTYRMAGQFLKNRFELLTVAIREKL
jgi:flagellar basal-body rod protein FlgB